MYKITDLSKQDYKKLLQIEKQLFDYPMSMQELLKFLKQSCFKIWKIELNEMIGYVSFFEIKDEVEIIKIGINKCHQRKQCGTSLIKEMKNKGFKNIFLEVSVNNTKAINFYLKNGFTKIGIRKRYYKCKDESRTDAFTLCLKIL